MKSNTTRFWIVFTLVLTFITGLVLGFAFYPHTTAAIFLSICGVGVALIMAKVLTA